MSRVFRWVHKRGNSAEAYASLREMHFYRGSAYTEAVPAQNSLRALRRHTIPAYAAPGATKKLCSNGQTCDQQEKKEDQIIKHNYHQHGRKGEYKIVKHIKQSTRNSNGESKTRDGHVQISLYGLWSWLP